MNKQLGWLDRYLTVWIFAAMAVGLLLGRLVPGLPVMIERSSVGTTNIPIAIGLIVMMFPPLAKVNYKLLPAVFRNVRVLGFSLLLNWVLGPILMFALAILFLADHPEYMSGIILIGLARCIAMVAESVLIYLGIPFALGFLTRQIYLRHHSLHHFENVISPRLSPLTLIALLFTIVVMFSLKSDSVFALPGDVLLIAAPLTIYFGLMFLVGYFVTKAAGAPYDQSAAVAFTAAGNNFELAIAVAIGVFGLNSRQAFAGVVGPLIEVPALILLVGVARKLQPKTSAG